MTTISSCTGSYASAHPPKTSRRTLTPRRVCGTGDLILWEVMGPLTHGVQIEAFQRVQACVRRLGEYSRSGVCSDLDILRQ